MLAHVGNDREVAVCLQVVTLLMKVGYSVYYSNECTALDHLKDIILC